MSVESWLSGCFGDQRFYGNGLVEVKGRRVVLIEVIEERGYIEVFIGVLGRRRGFLGFGVRIEVEVDCRLLIAEAF